MIQTNTLTSSRRKASTLLRGGLLLLPLVVVGVQWVLDSVAEGQLLTQVRQIYLLDWLETPMAYLYLHLVTVVPVLALSFDRRVHYYRQWRYLWAPIVLVGGFFLVWDVVFTARGVWGFNHDYVSGLFFLRLPIEEWMFFVTVPFACVFIYECLNHYVKADLLKPFEPVLTPILIVTFLGTGIWFFWHQYTATTFLLAGGLLLFHYLFLDGHYRSRFYLAYGVIWIPFLLINGVLTGGYTQAPIVQYNPEEYLGIRVTSVPLDDSVYNFLMLFGIVTLYERNKDRHT
jgi:lycopene cyclase domain-containing protein